MEEFWRQEFQAWCKWMLCVWRSYTGSFPQIPHFKKWPLWLDCSSQSLFMHFEMAHLIQSHTQNKIWQKSSCSNECTCKMRAWGAPLTCFLEKLQKRMKKPPLKISTYDPEDTEQMKNISSQASLLKFSKNSNSFIIWTKKFGKVTNM